MFNRSQIMTEAHRIAAECRANAFYTDWTRGQVMAMALRAAWLNAKRDAHYSRPSPVLSERDALLNKDRWSRADYDAFDRLAA